MQKTTDRRRIDARIRVRTYRNVRLVRAFFEVMRVYSFEYECVYMYVCDMECQCVYIEYLWMAGLMEPI